jgi:hypothetical protein
MCGERLYMVAARLFQLDGAKQERTQCSLVCLRVPVSGYPMGIRLG